MMVMSNEDFAKKVLQTPPNDKPFKAEVSYDIDGDCLEFIAKPDDFYAERVDDLLTVYYSRETNEIIGSLIKGVSNFYKCLLRRVPGFQVEVRDGRILLAHLFRARLWSESPDKQKKVIVRTYQKLAEFAEQVQAEVEMTGV